MDTRALAVSRSRRPRFAPRVAGCLAAALVAGAGPRTPAHAAPDETVPPARPEDPSTVPAGEAPAPADVARELEQLRERVRALEARKPAPAPLPRDAAGRPEPPAQDAPAAGEAAGPGVGATLDELAKAGLRFTGLVFTTFQYDWNRPPKRFGSVGYRSIDADDRTFDLELAKLGLGRDVGKPGDWGDVGFRLDLAFGHAADVIDTDPLLGSNRDAFAIEQAFATYRLPLPFDLDLSAGKFVAFTGAEYFEPNLNPCTSRSFVFGYATPNWHTGVSAKLSPFEGLSYTQYVVSGWDRAFGTHGLETLGGSLALAPKLDDDLATSWTVSWLFGPEHETREGPKRFLLDTVLNVSLWKRLTLIGEALYGHEDEVCFQDGHCTTAEWVGAFLVLQVKPLDWLALSGRLEWLRDATGARTGVEQELREATLMVETTFVVKALTFGLRGEVRADASTRRTFVGHDGPRSCQGTVGFAAFAAF